MKPRENDDIDALANVAHIQDPLEPDYDGDFFQRRTLSLPHHYKMGLPYDHTRKVKTHSTSAAEPSKRSKIFKVTPTELKRRIDIMKTWLADFSEEQRTLVFQNLFVSCIISFHLFCKIVSNHELC